VRRLARDRSARPNRQLHRALAAALRPPAHRGHQAAHSLRQMSALVSRTISA
jgi:hypothetical protein